MVKKNKSVNFARHLIKKCTTLPQGKSFHKMTHLDMISKRHNTCVRGKLIISSLWYYGKTYTKLKERN